jgi:hypothetical protein
MTGFYNPIIIIKLDIEFRIVSLIYISYYFNSIKNKCCINS